MIAAHMSIQLFGKLDRNGAKRTNKVFAASALDSMADVISGSP